MRKELKATKLTDANEVYYRIFNLLINRQNEFDKETNHGRNKGKEKEWQVIIAKELAESDGFGAN